MLLFFFQRTIEIKMQNNFVLNLIKQFSFETQSSASGVCKNRLNHFSDLEGSWPRGIVNTIGIKISLLLQTQFITNY